MVSYQRFINILGYIVIRAGVFLARISFSAAAIFSSSSAVGFTPEYICQCGEEYPVFRGSFFQLGQEFVLYPCGAGILVQSLAEVFQSGRAPAISYLSWRRFPGDAIPEESVCEFDSIQEAV